MTQLQATSVVYEFSDFRLEPARRLLTRGGAPLAMTAKAFDALVCLVEHAGTVVTRAQLTETLWPRTIVEDNNLNKLIASLRHALGENGERRYIVTLQGRGYQFVAGVRMADADHGGVDALRSDRDAEPVPQPAGALPSGAKPRNRRRAAAAVIGAVGLGAGAALVLMSWSRVEPGGPALETVAEPLGTVVRVARVTRYVGDELSPSLSPDGESVAFSWDGRDGNRDIYVTRIGASEALRLTDAPEPDRNPAWSPDGDRIAFLRQIGPYSFDLFVMPAVGGPERRYLTLRLRPRHAYGSPQIAWMPDGQGLIYTTRSGDDVAAAHHLYLLRFASGEPVQLTRGDGVYDTSPAISADGRWLAFVRRPNSIAANRGRLLAQPLTAAAGAAAELLEVPAPEFGTHSPSWSAEGRYLSFVARGDLVEWENGAAAPRLVHAGAVTSVMVGDYGGLSLIRTGGRARAVFATNKGAGPSIFSLRLAPGTHEPMGPPARRFASNAAELHPRFSADGQSVALVSARADGNNREDVWIAAVDGGDMKQLTDMRANLVGIPRWSPEGKRIAFFAVHGIANRNVYIVDVDGGVPEPLAPGCCPEWSADGKYVYITEIDETPIHTISRVHVEDKHREPLFDNAYAVVAAGGSTLLYAKSAEAGVFRRSLEGDPRANVEEMLVEDHVAPGGIAATKDGFFYIGHSREGVPRAIRFYDYATRKARDIWPVGPNIVEMLTVAPNGTELLYAAQDDSVADLELLDLE